MSLRRRQDLFRPGALAARRDALFGEVLLSTPTAARRVLLFAGLAVAGVTALLLWGQYRARESVTGYLTGARGVFAVRADKAGRLVDLPVREGQRVRAGQVLARLAGDAFGPDENLSAIRVQAERQTVAELELALTRQAELDVLALNNLDQEIREAKTNLALLEAQLAAGVRRLRLAHAQVEIAGAAAERGLISRLERIRIEATGVDAELAADDVRLRLARQRANLEQLRRERAQVPLRAAQRRGELRRQLHSARAKRSGAAYAETFLLRAPVAGVITGLTVKEGQKVTAGLRLLTVQPEGPLVARLLVPTRVAGKLAEGQDARLRLAAFPYQKHGLLPARVTAVSSALAEAAELPPGLRLSEPAYWVTAELQPAPRLAAVALRPGMVLNADLLHDERRIWEWLAEPLLSLRR
ncbi:MAG: HlyD family efflux transporter periplasmic adaptor subunit [Pseudomonadota bacterium]